MNAQPPTFPIYSRERRRPRKRLSALFSTGQIQPLSPSGGSPLSGEKALVWPDGLVYSRIAYLA